MAAEFLNQDTRVCAAAPFAALERACNDVLPLIVRSASAAAIANLYYERARTDNTVAGFGVGLRVGSPTFDLRARGMLRKAVADAITAASASVQEARKVVAADAALDKLGELLEDEEAQKIARKRYVDVPVQRRSRPVTHVVAVTTPNSTSATADRIMWLRERGLVAKTLSRRVRRNRRKGSKKRRRTQDVPVVLPHDNNYHNRYNDIYAPIPSSSFLETGSESDAAKKRLQPPATRGARHVNDVKDAWQSHLAASAVRAEEFLT